jgi:hypothetical protein
LEIRLSNIQQFYDVDKKTLVVYGRDFMEENPTDDLE